ncbi:MAG: asparagine synthase (glutamine-hydrolyzing) [Myxococcales bacterium]|nr:asparagine synthase (glutamine-hydrolyzing) [Myxococcales bacterium]
MCGLVGAFAGSGDARGLTDRLARGADAIAHRGPDDSGAYCDGPVALGFRRLAILDLSPLGHQPMASARGDWIIVFNGEIYNFIELRRELEDVGVRFRSATDTEVLVEALEHWGLAAFGRFNGMWAVLAWQRSTQTLLACRDPWGIKPLYASKTGDTLFFASEIKAMRAMGVDLGTPNMVAARAFLDVGELDTGTRTLYRNVERLEPGQVYLYRAGAAPRRHTIDTDAWRVDATPFARSSAGEQEFVERFRAAFLAAVRIRLRSDVAVGTCLSGGLDSTAIACAAARFLPSDRTQHCRHAFTALIPEYDERRYIKAVVDQSHASWHTTVADDGQVAAEIEGFFRAHDEPVHTLGAFAGYLVMALARREGVKVLLNGQGSDELLAGYPSSTGSYLRSVLHRDGLVYAAGQAVAEGGSVLAGARLLARAASAGLAAHLPPALARRTRALVSLAAAKEGPDLIARTGPLAARGDDEPARGEGLPLALENQFRRFPLPLYLRVEDTNSSAYSIEARLPFLDPTVVALARVAPASLLRRDGMNKFLLRRILPGLVPDIVWQRRDKMGFPVPSARWLREPLRARFLRTLAPAVLARRGWYDAGVVADLTGRFLATDGPMPPPLQRLFMLESWAQMHLDG